MRSRVPWRTPALLCALLAMPIESRISVWMSNGDAVPGRRLPGPCRNRRELRPGEAHDGYGMDLAAAGREPRHHLTSKQRCATLLAWPIEHKAKRASSRAP